MSFQVSGTSDSWSRPSIGGVGKKLVVTLADLHTDPPPHEAPVDFLRVFQSRSSEQFHKCFDGIGVKVPNPYFLSSGTSPLTRSGRWVATPVGQVFLLHSKAWIQPMASIMARAL